jgi:hypothetical protein
MQKNIFILFGIIVVFFTQSYVNIPDSYLPGRNIAGINGRAPSLYAESKNVYMTFASGDSILYCQSSDNGKNFSAPLFVAALPKLGVGGGRGPQILSLNGQLVIAAADNTGNIYSFTKKLNAANWERGKAINDVPEVAKEGFVSLAGNNKGEVYAVWMDLRGNNKNKIAGASSKDGGRTWSKNRVIYQSPDSSVCECCKPSVVMRGERVVVMFRNWLNGNRDMYIIQSDDGGKNFGNAQKLGDGSWKLNACPMDGGGLVINNNNIQTIWRRQGNIYSCEAGKKEEMIATGKQCVIAGNDGKNFVAFVNDGKVYCRRPSGTRVELGSGGYPQVVAISVAVAFCAWEQDRKIYYSLLNN